MPDNPFNVFSSLCCCASVAVLLAAAIIGLALLLWRYRSREVTPPQ